MCANILIYIKLNINSKGETTMYNSQNQLIDLVNLASFILGIENLQANLTQSDKQDIIHAQNRNADRLLEEIHAHLQEQDQKINYLIKLLEKT